MKTCAGDEIPWKLSNYRKTLEVSAKDLHLGNTKQRVPLILAMFQETASAAITSYFRQCNGAYNYLMLINSNFKSNK